MSRDVFGVTLESHVADLSIHSSGRELGYAENLTTFALTATSYTDITGVAVTFTVVSRPVVLIAGCGQIQNTTAGAQSILLAITDSSDVAQVVGTSYHSAQNLQGNITIRRRLSLAPGNYTYKLRGRLGVAGSANLLGTASPIYIQAQEV